MKSENICGGINRLIGIISPRAISDAASLSALPMTTVPRLHELGYIAVVGLILLVLLKEILSVSTIWEKDLESSFNLSIVPLLITFSAIVAFKTVEILLYD